MTPARDIFLHNPNKHPYLNKYTEPDFEHFENLVNQWDLICDNLVIFLGAGASVGAVNKSGEFFPTAVFLRNMLYKEFMLKKEEQESYDFSNLGLMSLEHACSIIEAHASRRDLLNRISQQFTSNGSLWQHATLPFLDPKAIFTTNYDTLIENGWNHFQNEKRLKHVFQVPHKKIEFTPLYKPHGSIDELDNDVNNGGIVITQFDYYEVLNNRKLMLERYLEGLEDKTVIFIGYSFNDFDISAILYDYCKRANRRNWYAVFPRNDNKVINMYLTRFKIKVIPFTFFEFMFHLNKAINFIPESFRFENLSEDKKLGLQGF